MTTSKEKSHNDNDANATALPAASFRRASSRASRVVAGDGTRTAAAR